jgi:uncharacterized DUF497 family protein
MAVLKLGNLHFVWDDKKAASNLTKHGVSFPEAATAFLDEYAEMDADPDHSEEENRFLLLATSVRQRILLVVHVERDVHIRIISARAAKPNERRRYEQTRTGGR